MSLINNIMFDPSNEDQKIIVIILNFLHASNLDKKPKSTVAGNSHHYPQMIQIKNSRSIFLVIIHFHNKVEKFQAYRPFHDRGMKEFNGGS